MSLFASHSMRVSSIRKYVYAALLALSTLTSVPVTAFAQTTARGKFTLPHEVHWENATVPAGNYQFSLESGSIEVLRLDELNGSRAAFTLVVRDEQPNQRNDLNRLVLEATPRGPYVTTMQLSDFGQTGSGVTLNFTVPASAEKSAADKQATKAVTTPVGAQ